MGKLLIGMIVNTVVIGASMVVASGTVALFEWPWQFQWFIGLVGGLTVMGVRDE